MVYKNMLNELCLLSLSVECYFCCCMHDGIPHIIYTDYIMWYGI